MNENKLEKIQEYLTPEELVAYNSWKDSDQPELALSLNVKLYSLFLNGNSCEDIVRLNPGISLGQVINARIQSGWDKRKEAYLSELLDRTEKRHRQVAMETINFISDLLAVNNNRYGTKLKKYLISQKEEDLGDLAISLKQFREMAELHQKLSGTEGIKRQIVSGEVVVTHKTDETPMDSEEAGEEISRLLEERKL